MRTSWPAGAMARGVLGVLFAGWTAQVLADDPPLGPLARPTPATDDLLSVAQPPTIFIAGDSTTAPGSNGTQGWGEYLRYSFGNNANVSNMAVGGRSARSFTREGRFDRIAQNLKPGDWVIIEFGINDAGAPINGSTSTTGDKGRIDCPGAGEETCISTFNNVTEVVQTFGTYVKNASRIFLDKGAQIILSHRLPVDAYQKGDFAYNLDIYSYYTWLATEQLGGSAAGVWFVQHGAYAAQAQRGLGKNITQANYPNDHTHPSPYLADV